MTIISRTNNPAWSLGSVVPTLLLVIPIMVCNGCAKIGIAAGAAPKPPSVIVSRAYGLDQFDKDVARYASAANAAEQQMVRNHIAYSVMGEIDRIYGDFVTRLFAGKGTTGVIGDSLTLGLTAATTIAPAARTKTIFGALATGLTGMNLSLDKNFFAQQTFQAIAAAMQIRRDKARAQIILNLTKDVSDYPLAAARRDLISYLGSGTLAGGLQELYEMTATQRQVTEPHPLH